MLISKVNRSRSFSKHALGCGTCLAPARIGYGLYMEPARIIETMYLKCAHPECSSDFDSGHGRLFRFQQNPHQDQQPSHWHSVKHFWLCGRCCETYTIGYRKGLGVVLMNRVEGLSSEQTPHFILQADPAVKRGVIRRHGRAAAGEHTRKKKLAPVQASAIEILENRNLERRG
jgi:hypothetical protein